MVVERDEKRCLLNSPDKRLIKIVKSKNKKQKWCGKQNLYEVYTMANTKITERDLMNSILDGTVDNDVLVEYAEKRLAQLDKRTASAKVRAEKKRAESDELTETVFSLLSDEPQNRDMLVAKLAELGIESTPNKVTARLTKLVKAERVTREKGKIVGEDGKTHETTLYVLA